MYLSNNSLIAELCNPIDVQAPVMSEQSPIFLGFGKGCVPALHEGKTGPERQQGSLYTGLRLSTIRCVDKGGLQLDHHICFRAAAGLRSIFPQLDPAARGWQVCAP
eukprot:TRINITY_DN8137_c0_g1_i4.p2 TRINITY_DN8137_c0_g1~~TRINITY_DN8137_c0_g1_i4.p2  ORF type:complete len:106 (+),score=9.98 TRINITY_DN8137_c0_g1_i4:437-754(+)